MKIDLPRFEFLRLTQKLLPAGNAKYFGGVTVSNKAKSRYTPNGYGHAFAQDGNDSVLIHGQFKTGVF